MRLPVSHLFFCLVLISSASVRAQDANFGAREDDARAATIEQRQSRLTDVLAQVQNARASGDLVAAAGLLARAGRLQVKLHRSDEALTTYREVLKLTEHNPNLSAEVDALNGMAAIYAEGKCGEADTLLKRAQALTKSGDYDAGKAESLLVLSDCQNHSDHEAAVNTAKDALVIWQSINSKWGMARAYMAIGDYQFSRNELIPATESLQTSQRLWIELNVPSEQAETLISLGFIEYRRGSWQESIRLLSQAQSLLDEEAEPYRMGQIAGGIAEAFIESGLPEVGLEKLKIATEYFRRANSSRALIAMYWDTGRAHYFLGDYAQALEDLNTGWSEAQIRDEPILGALCAEYLGRTYAAMHDYDKALQRYQWALSRYGTSNPMETARTTALVGQIYQLQGKLQQSKQQYVKALFGFQRLSDHLNESATLYALGMLELQQNDLSWAEEYLKRSLDATENIRSVSTSNDLTAAFSATIQERYDAYIDCLMRQSRLRASDDIAVRAFEMSELARARSLADFLRGTQGNLARNVAPQLAEKEESLRQELRVKEDSKVLLLAKNYKRADLEALVSNIAALETEYKNVVEKIRSQYPAYDQITAPRAWDLQRIRDEAIADDDTALLEYSLGTERSYVWVVTKKAFATYELPSERDIAAVAKTVYESLKTAQTGAAERNDAARKLSQMILSPITQKLPRQIIVVSDGVLNYVPFQVLSMPSESDTLIANHVVANAPSATILGQLQLESARRPVRPRLLAAFGDPTFQSNFSSAKGVATNAQPSSASSESERSASALRDIEVTGDSADPARIQPLFFAKQELTNLQDIAGAETLVATGFEASRERLETADLTRYAILHFATHGILDPKRPENSGIFLSTVQPDGRPRKGYVSLQDIYGLRAPVDLVVLSACRTGLGKEVRGEGLIGLTRGFMYAGAASVVASLWKVDDEATAELMKRFYANMLRRGMKPADALRAAQNSIRQEPQWSSPYYWAAFTLQGEYRNPIKVNRVQSTRSEVFSVMIFTAAVGILLLLSYRRMRAGLAKPTRA